MDLKGLRRDARPFCAAVLPLLTEKAVNLNGIYIRRVKDIMK